MELKNVEIIKIGEVKTFGNDFRKLEFVVRDDSSQYPQEIPFSIIKDKIDNFIQFNKVGQRVDVSFNLNGRSWLKDGEDESKRRWFTDLNAWKVFKSEAHQQQPKPEIQSAPDLTNSGPDDMPF